MTLVAGFRARVRYPTGDEEVRGPVRTKDRIGALLGDPLQAAIDYVSTFGCKRDEIVTIGVDTVAPRGAQSTE